MFDLKIIEEISDDEIDLIIAVFKVFGRKITWQILRELYRNQEDITQKELCKILHRSSLSRELNDMKALGLIVESPVHIDNPMKTEKCYELSTHNCYQYIDKIIKNNIFEIKSNFQGEIVRDILNRIK
ncbi:unknown [Clostridium sp. CAG:768]|nr:unknown [Clostridium sp. CAG:768]